MGNYLSTSNKESIKIIDNADHIHVIMSTLEEEQKEEQQKEEKQEKTQNLKTNEENENTQNVVSCDTVDATNTADIALIPDNGHNDGHIFYKKM